MILSSHIIPYYPIWYLMIRYQIIYPERHTAAGPQKMPSTLYSEVTLELNIRNFLPQIWSKIRMASRVLIHSHTSYSYFAWGWGLCWIPGQQLWMWFQLILNWLIARWSTTNHTWNMEQKARTVCFNMLQHPQTISISIYIYTYIYISYFVDIPIRFFKSSHLIAFCFFTFHQPTLEGILFGTPRTVYPTCTVWLCITSGHEVYGCKWITIVTIVHYSHYSHFLVYGV